MLPGISYKDSNGKKDIFKQLKILGIFLTESDTTSISIGQPSLNSQTKKNHH